MKKSNLIALVILTMLLTACGGDSKTETPTTEVTEEVPITDVNATVKTEVTEEVPIIDVNTTVKTETQNDIINTGLAKEQLTPVLIPTI